MNKCTLKNAPVFRQFVFVGHTPHGRHRELVAADRHEIDTIVACEQLSGLLTYHNVKVWPKGSYNGGQFVASNAQDVSAEVFIAR